MDGIFSIVDLAHLGLSIEKLKVGVAAENIANVHNVNYSQKVVNGEEFQSLLQSDSVFRQDGGLLKEDINSAVYSNNHSSINLDDEVLSVTNAELRYQAIAQMIQKKFGLIELSMGVKK